MGCRGQGILGAMPELPDVDVYVERLDALFTGRALLDVRLGSPFLVRTAVPPLDQAKGRRVLDFRRLGKRIVFCLEDDLFLVLHLMIAGRLRLKKAGVAIPKKRGLAAFDFETGSVLLTEASPKKRASLHVVQGLEALAEHDPGGLEVIGSTFAAFDEALTRRNHTLKRALSDPTLLSGIGNAYSDEILHHARLSPVKQTQRMGEADKRRLHASCQQVLLDWTARLRAEVGADFPDKVTAFRDGMAVHGRYLQPCPDCGTKVQRIAYASNETNYCPQCQTEGKLLADRSLSRLLKKDWPRTPEALEDYKAQRKT